MRAELLRLIAHLVHKVRAEDAIRESGEVLDGGSVHQLPARGQLAGKHQRTESRTRKVNGRCVSGRTGTDDDGRSNVALLLCSHAFHDSGPT